MKSWDKYFKMQEEPRLGETRTYTSMTQEDIEEAIKTISSKSSKKRSKVYAGVGFLKLCVETNGVESVLGCISFGTIVPIDQAGVDYIKSLTI